MGQGSEGKTIAEEVPESVELREIGLSFALPMGKSISRTLTRELRTQLQTRLRISLSQERLSFSSSPAIYIDAQWPAKNMDLGAASYSFVESHIDVTVSSISGPAEGWIDFSADARKEVGALLAAAAEKTAAAKPGYRPFEDRAWRETLDAVIANLRAQPSSGPSDVRTEDFTEPRIMAKLKLRAPFRYESEGTGLEIPEGAVFALVVSGKGNLKHILAAETLAEKVRAAALESLCMESDSIFVLAKGQRVASLDRVRIDRGGAAVLEQMRLFGVVGEAEGMETLIKTVVAVARLVSTGVALPDAIAHAHASPDVLAEIVPGLVRGKIEEALAEGARRLIRERARTIPGLDLCEVFGIAGDEGAPVA